MGIRTDQLRNAAGISRMGCDDVFALAEQLEKELDEVCNENNIYVVYVPLGGTTYAIYGSSSIAAFNYIRQLLNESKAELNEFRSNVFQAHPNIDLDIAYLEKLGLMRLKKT